MPKIRVTKPTGINVQEEGTTVGKRNTLNFIGELTTVEDDPVNKRINIITATPTLDQAYDAGEVGKSRIVTIDDGSVIFDITDTSYDFEIQLNGKRVMRYDPVNQRLELYDTSGRYIKYHPVTTVSSDYYFLVVAGATVWYFTSDYVDIYKNFRPKFNNEIDLGAPNRGWKDFYLSGQAKMNSGYFGDGTTNYADFSSTGLLTMHGTARVRKNVEIAVGAIKPPASHPASWSDLGIAGAWEFSDGVTETVILEMPLPLDIDRSEDVVVDIAWSSPSTSGNCVWQLQYLLRGEDEAIDASADDTLTQTVAPSSTANGLVTTSFTIPAADISDTDKLLILRLERLGGDANDTLGDVAYLTAMNFNYVSDKLGEAT